MTISLLYSFVLVVFIAIKPVKSDINVTKTFYEDIFMKHQIKNGQYQLKHAQIKKMINAAPNIRDRLIIKLLYYCGLRRSEVVSIQPGDLDTEKNSLTVRGKGGKIRVVPVPSDTMAEIKIYLGRTRRPYLFNAKKLRRAPLVKQAVNRIVRAAGEAAQVKNPNPRMVGVNPHLLRHSAARRLKDKGLSLECISNFLGHEKLSITADIYGLMSFDEVMKQVSEVMN